MLQPTKWSAKRRTATFPTIRTSWTAPNITCAKVTDAITCLVQSNWSSTRRKTCAIGPKMCPDAKWRQSEGEKLLGQPEKKRRFFFQRNQLKFNQHNSTLPFLHKLKTEQSTVDSHLTKLSKQKQSQVHVPPFFSKTHGQQDNRHISSRQNPFFKKKSLVFTAAPIDGVVRPSLPFSSYHEHGQQMALMSAWRATKVKKWMKWWCTGNQTQTKKKGHCSGSNRDPPEKIWICHRRCDF